MIHTWVDATDTQERRNDDSPGSYHRMMNKHPSVGWWWVCEWRRSKTVQLWQLQRKQRRADPIEHNHVSWLCLCKLKIQLDLWMFKEPDSLWWCICGWIDRNIAAQIPWSEYYLHFVLDIKPFVPGKQFAKGLKTREFKVNRKDDDETVPWKKTRQDAFMNSSFE